MVASWPTYVPSNLPLPDSRIRQACVVYVPAESTQFKNHLSDRGLMSCHCSMQYQIIAMLLASHESSLQKACWLLGAMWIPVTVLILEKRLMIEAKAVCKLSEKLKDHRYTVLNCTGPQDQS